MAKMQKGNVIVEVADSQVDRYINLGYDEIDKNGRILRQSIPIDIGPLKAAYAKHVARIKELEDENLKLKAQVEDLQNQIQLAGSTQKAGRRNRSAE